VCFYLIIFTFLTRNIKGKRSRPLLIKHRLEKNEIHSSLVSLKEKIDPRKAEILKLFFQKPTWEPERDKRDLKRGAGIHAGLGEEGVKKNFNNPAMFKSTGPNGRHPRVLNELAEVFTEPLDIIFENSWRTDEVLKTGKGQI
jgi:hypothetical protein